VVANAPAALTRSSIDTLISTCTALINKDRLLEAERTGLCEPLDLTPRPSEDFYLGEDAQPGHVGAGLVVPRPQVTAAVAKALAAGAPMLLTGPSGVGKSAAAWSAAAELSAVAWHRVHSLSTIEDVTMLLDLARQKGASHRAPLGFIVDPVVPGDAAGWDTLVRRTKAQDGIALLGTVRAEDTFLLTTRAMCREVPVSLDSQVAETIHRRLRDTGKSTAPHWREAFAAADGLTLEYCHLLTQGQHLADVIGAQVDDRLHDGSRSAELDVLAVVATAHTWNAEIPTDGLRRQLGLDAHAFHSTLRRLIDEHLVREQNGLLAGRHAVRSAALTRAIHALDSPSLADSAQLVIDLLPSPGLTRFIAGFLIDNHEADEPVLSRAARRVAQAAPLTSALADVIHAVNLVDTHRAATHHIELLKLHGAPPGNWVNALRFARLPSMQALLPMVRQELAPAYAALAAAEDPAALLERLMGLLTPVEIGRRLAACTSCHEAADILSVLSNAPTETVQECIDEIGSRAPLAQTLRECRDLDASSEVLATAFEASRELACALAGTMGDRHDRLARITAGTSRMAGSALEFRDGALTATAELRYIDDFVTPEPQPYSHAVAGLMLSLLPECDRVDVRTRFPGGIEASPGGVPLGSSQLRREFGPSRFAVARERARLSLASLIASPLERTRWLDEALHLLDELHAVALEMACNWATGSGPSAPGDELLDLASRQANLLQRLENLPTTPPYTDPIALRPGEQGPLASFNPLQSLGRDLLVELPQRLGAADVAGVLGILTTRVLSALPQLSAEPWHLIDRAPAPASLTALDALARDLIDVVSTIGRGILKAETANAAAHNGPAERAIARVAAAARTRSAQIDELMRTFLMVRGRELGAEFTLLSRPRTHLPGSDQQPYGYLALIPINSVEQWPNAAAAVMELFSQSQFTTEPLLITATVGKAPVPVRQLSLERREGDWIADADALRSWGDAIGRPLPTPMTDAFGECVAALSLISGLGELSRCRALNESQSVAIVSAQSRVAEASATMKNLAGTDSVATALTTAMELLATELSDGTHTWSYPAVLAAQISGTPDAEFAMIARLSAVALDCDVRTYLDSADPPQGTRTG
jgi:hypothetical protein